MKIKENEKSVELTLDQEEVDDLNNNIIPKLTSKKTIPMFTELIVNDIILNYTMSKYLEVEKLKANQGYNLSIAPFGLLVNIIKLDSVVDGITYNLIEDY